MGMIAEYMMIDEDTLNSLMELNSEDLTNRLMELEESKVFKSITIDKVWDALHYFLTGVSAAEPIEGNKLSEAVVGVHVFNDDDENADFITCIENEELSEIITAMKSIDFERLAADFVPKRMKKHKIYPGGIENDSKDQLVGEFKEAVADILKFYKSALRKRCHIIVSIL